MSTLPGVNVVNKPAADLIFPDDFIGRVVFGDSIEILRRIPDGVIDAVVTDPPYSSGGMFRGDRAMATGQKYVLTGVQTKRADFTGDNRDQRSFLFWSTLWVTQCQRILKEGGPALVFTDWRQLPLTTDYFQAGGLVWRGILPWDKEYCRPTMGRFAAQCEYVVWGSNGPMAQDEKIGCLPGVVREPVIQSDKHHQTGKPTQLMRKLLAITKPGDLVIDPFCRSGSTLVAAQETGRRWIGIDNSFHYCGFSAERVKQGELF